MVTEQFRGPAQLDQLREVVDAFPVIPHGLGLSIGTAGPIDKEYLDQIKRVSDLTRSPYYSDHLCMTRAAGIDLGQLAPLWFRDDVLRPTIDRVNEVQDELGKPLVLENVTYLFEILGADMSQAEFFHRLVDATGCGILLDVTNVYTNAVNHHFDPALFMAEMPLHSVVQVHLAADSGTMACWPTAIPNRFRRRSGTCSPSSANGPPSERACLSTTRISPTSGC